MSVSLPLGLLTLVAPSTASAADPTPTASTPASPPPAAAGSTVVESDGSPYVPIPTARLVEGALLAKGAEVTVPVAGRAGVPAQGVSAVVLVVRVSGAPSSGQVSTWATGDPRPGAASLTYGARQPVTRTVVARVGREGRVSLAAQTTGRLWISVSGWFGEGSGVRPLTPARLLDRRAGGSTVAGRGGGGPLRPGGVLDVQVRGRGGVPADASAVLLNVTAVSPAKAGHVTAWAGGIARPAASALSYRSRTTTTGLVLAGVGSRGRVSLSTSTAAVLVVDVVGWVPATGLAAVSPARLLDGRRGQRTVDGRGAGGGPLRGTIDLPVAGRGGVPAAGARAVVLTVTALPLAAGGQLTAWPTGAPRPATSQLEHLPRETTSGLIVAELGRGGRVSLSTSTPAYVLVDVVGWFAQGKTVSRLVVPPTTVLAGAGDVAGGVRTDESTGRSLVQLTGSSDPVRVGDVLTVAPSAADPHGALGRVVSVTPSAGGGAQTVLEPVRLEDAVPQGRIDYSGPVEGLLGDGALRALAVSALKCQGSLLSFGASVEVRAHLDLHLGWGNGDDDVRIVLELGVKGKLEVTGGFTGDCEVTTLGPPMPLPGPLPITLALGQFYGLSAKVAAIQAEVTWDAAFRVGVHRADGNVVWVAEPSGTRDFSWKKLSQAEGDLRLRWGTAANLSIAKVVGVTVRSGPELGARISLSGANFVCRMSAGHRISASVGVSRWFGKLEAELGSRMYGETDLGSVGCGTEAEPVIATGDLEPGVTDVGYFQPLDASGGVKPLSWAARGLPPGLRVEGATITGRPTSAFDGEVELVVTDAARREVSRKVRLVVKGISDEQRALLGTVARLSDGRAYYVDQRGGTHHVPNGGVYDCLVAQGVVVRPASPTAVKGLPEYEAAACVRAAPGDIVTEGRRSYLVEPDLGLRHIADVISYECLTANSHQARGQVPRYWVLDRPRKAEFTWHCWDPVRARGKVVRFTDGSSWYVDLRGDGHHVPDGGTYECLKSQRGDYGDRIPVAWRASMMKYEDARCIKVQPGQIVRFGGDTYLVSPDFGVGRIPDGISFLCLTANGATEFGAVPRYWLLDAPVKAEAVSHCWNKDRAKGKVVRFSDGSSWYVDLRGDRHHVPNGGTYECLKQQRGDYGMVVPADRLGEMTPYEDAQCVRANPGDVVIQGADSYLVESDFGRRRIVDGISYECLAANGHRRYGEVPRYWLLDARQHADYVWHCWNKDSARGKVVRFSDGSSWYIDLRGGRHHIPDGGTYECLKGQRGDYGHVVPAGRLGEMPRYEDAACIRANAGDVVKHSNGDSWIYTGGKRHIVSTAVYNCYRARGHRFLDVPRYWLDDLSRQGDVGPGEACNLIITHSGGNDSHHIDGNGIRHWIETREVYACLERRGLKRFWTSDRSLIDRGWTERGWATC